MRHLSLFTGTGATDLAAERAGFTTIATAENDPWLRDLLRVRFPRCEKHYKDVRDVGGALGSNLLAPDLITGGFPCPDVSNAGTHSGLSGDRSGLWTEFARIIREFKPRYVLAENVAALKVRGLHFVLADLYQAGYSVRWDCIPAAAVGAPHLRDRIWVKAVRDSFVRPIQGEKIGDIYGSGVVAPGDWNHPIFRFPRSGTVDSMGVVREAEPVATAKMCRQYNRTPLIDVGVLPWRDKHMPTPTYSDGTGGPGTTPKRTGGMNLRTWIAVNRETGPLNPDFIEWMMGLPIGWTNPDLSRDQLTPFGGWYRCPVPPVDHGNKKHRRARLRALGNALVPQLAQHQIEQLWKGAIP